MWTDKLKTLGEIRFFGKIMGSLVLLGTFYLIMEQSQTLGAETIKNILFMVVGGAVTVLFGSKD